MFTTLKTASPRTRRHHRHYHRSAWELLVATILSAQSTDVVVNQVTPELFRRYPAPADLAAADRAEVEVRGVAYVLMRERDLHAVAAERLEGSDDSTGLYL